MWYDFICGECGEVETVQLLVSQRDSISVCSKCNGTMQRDTKPGNVNVVLKGVGWPSKEMHEKVVRAQRSADMGRKMRDNVASPKLIPNFRGQIANTWADAQGAAHDAGCDTASYDSFVATEKAGKSGSRSVVTGS